jgi:diamine N-acetyltransferase
MTAGRGIIAAVIGARVTLQELTEANRADVLALRIAPGQERFVSSVTDSLNKADAYPQAKPWYRAVYAGDEPVGSSC